MSTITRVILGIVVVCLVALGIAFAGARYLVGRLDGRGPQVPAVELSRYSSEDGLMFMYPSSYQLSSRTAAAGSSTRDMLVLLPPGTVAPKNGEQPPAISISVFYNVPENLEQWVGSDPRSNFALQGSDLASTTVGGEPALRYEHSGLYETDAVAVLHKGKIFLFEAQWLASHDAIRQDFQNILNTVHFEL